MCVCIHIILCAVAHVFECGVLMHALCVWKPVDRHSVPLILGTIQILGCYALSQCLS